MPNFVSKFNVLDELINVRDSLAVHFIETTTKLLANEGNFLKNNDIYLTAGYASINDGGGAMFRIVTVNTNENEYYLKISNAELYASIIAQPNMHSLQFGILPSDDNATDKFNTAIAFVTSYGDKTLTIDSGEYMIDAIGEANTSTFLRNEGGIKLLSGTRLVLDKNAVLKCKATNHQAYNILRVYNVSDVHITGGKLIGDRANHTGSTGEWGYGIAVSGSSDIYISDIECREMWGDGINLKRTINESTPNDCKRVYINNVICDRNRRQGCSIESGVDCVISNSKFINTNGTLPQSGIDIEPAGNDHANVTNLVISNCEFYGNSGRNFMISNADLNSVIDGVLIDNCTFGDNTDPNNYMCVMDAGDNVTFKNCTFNAVTAYIILFTASGHFNVVNSLLNDARIQQEGNNNECIVNGCILTCSKHPTLLSIIKAKYTCFINNVCRLSANDFINPTGSPSGYIDIMNNVFNSSASNVGVVRLDDAPNCKLTAVNNKLNGTGMVLTWKEWNANQNIANGAFGGMTVYAGGRPADVKTGAILYDISTGRIIVKSGNTWRYVGTTAES